MTVQRASGRRRLLISAAALAALPRSAFGGAQQYEPLADSVRTALAAQIAEERPRERPIDKPEERLAHYGWLGEMSERLKAKIPEFSAMALASDSRSCVSRRP